MITRNEKIKDLIEKYPEVTQVFLDYNLRCLGCPAFGSETIEEAARSHGIKLEPFLSDINKTIQKNENSAE